MQRGLTYADRNKLERNLDLNRGRSLRARVLGACARNGRTLTNILGGVVVELTLVLGYAVVAVSSRATLSRAKNGQARVVCLVVVLVCAWS